MRKNMQGKILSGIAGVVALTALIIAGCHGNSSSTSTSTAVQTPLPSKTTLAMALTKGPGDKYIAQTSTLTHGVVFDIWANGKPIASVRLPGTALDITKDLRGHANHVVVKWSKTQKNGSGALFIHTLMKTVLATTVSPAAPMTGQQSRVLAAPNAPAGRP